MLRRALIFLTLTTGPLHGQVVVADTTAYPVDPLSIPRPILNALRITDNITLDGLLNEASWSRAKATNRRWIQITPDPGMPASEHTVIRILYDDKNLYVGAVLHDSDPENLIIPGLEQDYDVPNSDMLGLAFDTYHDQQNGFVFAINPGGAVWDAQVFNDQASINPAWEGIVDVETTVNDSSWVVEVAIPFSTLRFNPIIGDQIWGVNFTRRLRRRNEDSMWAPVPLQYRVYRFSLAGTLTGLRDLPRGRNLWLKPYVLGNRLDGTRHEPGTSDGDVGLDIKWGLTPRLTLDLTTNTDFSQVEVDTEQVNLTRFSLFFPEKRDFFLENEGTFAFQDMSLRNFRTGSSPRSFRLFHSRRIGLSETREPLPIMAGARLTGRVGERLEIGVLDMHTRAVEGPNGLTMSHAENFAVARVKGQLSGGSAIGAMFVNRQQSRTGNHPLTYNRAYGIDGNFNLFSNVFVSGYLARTEENDPLGNDQKASMVQAAWRSAIWNISGLFKQVGDGFNPGLGFIDRTAVRRYYGTIGIHPKVRRAGILEVNPYLDADAYTALDGILETRTLTPGLKVVLMDGGSVNIEYKDRYEQLFTTTTIAGTNVSAGTYSWREPSIRYATSGSKTLSGMFAFSGGDFYDGHRMSLSASATYRPNEHFSLDLSMQHNNLELAGEDFTANLFTTRLQYGRDKRTFFMGFLQYNETTGELITNARFNFIHAPLSDIFLVYTERRSFSDKSMASVLERGITLKVTRLLAF